MTFAGGLTASQRAFRKNVLGGYRSFTLADVPSVVSYNRDTGVFTRLTAVAHMKVGDVCGMLHHTGYVLIRIKSVRIPAHILAWMFAYGECPPCDVDHKDGDRANNAIENLRLAIGCGNAQNAKRRSDNSSGFKGVYYFKKNKKWGASIQSGGVRVFVGLFHSPESAFSARCQMAMELHGEFARAA